MYRQTRTVKFNSAFLNFEFESTASMFTIWTLMILWLVLWAAVYTGVFLAITAALIAVGVSIPYWAGAVLGWGLVFFISAIKD